MKVLKIVTVCGMGWGSSLLLKINLDEVLKNNGIKDFDIDACDLGSAKSAGGDIIVGTEDMRKHLKDEKNAIVVFVKSLVDKEELAEKVINAVKKWQKENS